MREDNDLTQKQVSAILNCSQQVYSNYELGQRDIPTALLIKIADFYNVSADYILERTDNPETNKTTPRLKFNAVLFYLFINYLTSNSILKSASGILKLTSSDD